MSGKGRSSSKRIDFPMTWFLNGSIMLEVHSEAPKLSKGICETTCYSFQSSVVVSTAISLFIRSANQTTS